MMFEFCWNENLGFPYKISLVNDISEQLLTSQLMLFSLFKRVFLMFTKLWQCRKKRAVNSTSKLHEHRGFMQSSQLRLNLCSFRWLSPSLKRVSSFNSTGLWMLSVGLGIGLSIFNSEFLKKLYDFELRKVWSSLFRSTIVYRKNVWKYQFCSNMFHCDLSYLYYKKDFL